MDGEEIDEEKDHTKEGEDDTPPEEVAKETTALHHVMSGLATNEHLIIGRL